MDVYIPLFRFASDIAMVVLIWLVQRIIYPSFYHIDADQFTAWHARYTRRISVVVIPLMMTQAVTTAFLLAQNPDPRLWMETVGLIAAWTVTFSLSVPCHKKLQESGKNEEVIHRLIATNWFRTAAWTLVLLLGLPPN
ncbi:hypothetical protein [Pontiella agarivorans]|uniref:DUF4149 domain-containing protein n=1 Tax=Pontiella agarivorans TaxID=3038953 RepID=A0ABU5MU31_9BACT|nr:hypothetical protein [Pontiella agarivorans]MDZ8117643.1 hypothetical protein [Pontiella agarivorans]